MKCELTAEDEQEILKLYQKGTPLSTMITQFRTSRRKLNDILKDVPKVSRVNRTIRTSPAKRRPELLYVTDGAVTTCDIYTKQLGKTVTIKFDTEDLERVAQFRWHVVIDRDGYTSVYGTLNRLGAKKSTFRMSRFIIKATDAKVQVDHINHDTTDNRKENLRVTEQYQNQQNRKGANVTNKTGILGVSWDNTYQRYVGQVQVNKKVVFKKTFKTLGAAASAVAEARRAHMPYSKEAANAA